MVSPESLIKGMIANAHEAGAIAYNRQTTAKASLKSDNTYVTEVDLELSELAVERLSHFVSPEHIVTEESDTQVLESGSFVKGAEDLVLIVDPIDGTRNYYHGMPLYGISIGAFYGWKPWLGVVTFPALDETFYADGTNAVYIEGPYRGAARELALTSSSSELTENSRVLLSTSFMKKRQWDYTVCSALVTGCVAINSCWPLLGRGVASIYSDYLWDIAGSWPILQHSGFEMRGVDSERLLTDYCSSDYAPESGRTVEPMLICRPEHFATLQKGAGGETTT